MAQLNAAVSNQSLNAATEILTEMSSSSLSDPSTENVQPINEEIEHEAAVDSPSTNLVESEAAL